MKETTAVHTTRDTEPAAYPSARKPAPLVLYTVDETAALVGDLPRAGLAVPAPRPAAEPVPADVDAARTPVRLDTGEWAYATVVPAPAEAPAAGRWSPGERRAALAVGVGSAGLLAVAIAVRTAGPYLADLADVLVALAVLIGAGAASWIALVLLNRSGGTRT